MKGGGANCHFVEGNKGIKRESACLRISTSRSYPYNIRSETSIFVIWALKICLLVQNKLDHLV